MTALLVNSFGPKPATVAKVLLTRFPMSTREISAAFKADFLIVPVGEIGVPQAMIAQLQELEADIAIALS